MNRPKIISGPHSEPITLTEAKAQARVDDTNSDTLITSLITAARESAEIYCGRAFVQRTYRITFDSFPNRRSTPIWLPYPPLVRVEQIQYYDTDDVLVTWGSGEYHVDTDSEPGRILPNYDASYPTDVIPWKVGAVRIDYVAGYSALEDGSPTDYVSTVPQLAKQAMLMMVAEWFKNRENTVVGRLVQEVPDAAKALLWQLKVFR